MNKNILLCINLLLLSSCATHQAQNEYNQKVANEAKAWNEAYAIFPQKCYPNKTLEEAKKPPKRSEIVAASDCMDVIVKEKVLPIAVYPDLILEMRAFAKRNSEDYALGKISVSEWGARADENQARYNQKVTERINLILQQASMKDAMFEQQFNSGFNQSVYSYNQVASKQTPAIQSEVKMPQTTNCSVGSHIGGPIAGSRSINCTTW